MRLQGLSCIGRAKRLWWLVALAFLIVIVVLLARYPRHVLLSDVGQASKIIVDWDQSDANGTRIAFELNVSDRAQFLRDLTENLELDYFRSQATAVPMIGIYLVDKDDKRLAYYVIRRARGGDRCPSMDSLRKLASRGWPLSQPEIDGLYNDNLRSKWPHILPWPECRFDYVLPATQTTEGAAKRDRSNFRVNHRRPGSFSDDREICGSWGAAPWGAALGVRP